MPSGGGRTMLVRRCWRRRVRAVAVPALANETSGSVITGRPAVRIRGFGELEAVTMDNLHTKGWLARERDGKAYRYWPTLSREQHSARLMREALDGGGSPEVVLQHFVEQIGAEESERLRSVLRRLAKGTKQ